MFHIDSLVRDDKLVPTIFYALLNILKQNALLNRVQSLKVLSALLFDNANIDLIVEQSDYIEKKNEYVLGKTTKNIYSNFFDIDIFLILILFT